MTEILIGADGRLDAALARAEPGFSRVQWARWIREGRVHIGGRAVLRPASVVRAGLLVRAVLPERRASDRLMPDPNIRFTVLFEDECLIVVDKPAGITVHPGTIGENATLVHGLLARFPDLQTSFAHEDDRRPGIVHRLDRGTSGVMVVARTPAARLALMAQFAHRDVEKTYLAWVLGAPPERGDWQSPIARHPRDRRRFAVSAKGKPAITHFVRERCRDGASRLRIQLETGRTHQIRVHASHAGFPLLGDPVYRRRVPVPADLTDWLPHRDRPALHSLSVRFRHPLDGREIFVESPLPDDLIDLDRRFV